MTRSTKAAQRNSVDVRFEQIAVASLGICERYVNHLQSIVAVLATAVRVPPITEDERRRQLHLLRATLTLAEKHATEAEHDYALFATVARHTRGLPSCELSMTDAAQLLTQRASDTEDRQTE